MRHWIAVAATLLAASLACAATPADDLNSIHGNMIKTPDVGPVSVAKAAGASGRTVAEVYSQSAALKDKPVVVHAKVVKVVAGVMGKNWVHLRDGSGSDAERTNDLVATSKDEPAVGEVVLAKGVVRTDVDLGSGYSYRVLVEDVSFTK
ncbi:MAG TPA: hypothetical protein VMN56_16690 [Casimicrobiaceae bacterium]|nr:hypothetical protein [Casimicrobiaceae bacterium]